MFICTSKGYINLRNVTRFTIDSEDETMVWATFYILSEQFELPVEMSKDEYQRLLKACLEE